MTDKGLGVALRRCPLMAILRGVHPNEVISIGEALVGAGFPMIEVPLNSPGSYRSIELLAARFPDVLIGAGTVLSPMQVGDVANAGGKFVVMPNTDPEVILSAKEAGLVALPGFTTPSEAFSALKTGADGLKLFPAEAVSPTVLKALRAVLPVEVPVLPVGSITVSAMPEWQAAGASGFGLGSSLYKPGATATEVSASARAFVQAVGALWE